MDIINIFFALASIGLGAFGFLAPRYTMGTLNMQGGESSMGLSEVRASAGALFIGMGVAALIIGTPTAYVMLGACWTGAATGRLLSLILDGVMRKKIIFFGCEVLVGVPAILLNI